jgi:hypothetical protein
MPLPVTIPPHYERLLWVNVTVFFPSIIAVCSIFRSFSMFIIEERFKKSQTDFMFLLKKEVIGDRKLFD